MIDRSAFAEPAKRPLEAERWAACIDSVGGNTLARDFFARTAQHTEQEFARALKQLEKGETPAQVLEQFSRGLRQKIALVFGRVEPLEQLKATAAFTNSGVVASGDAVRALGNGVIQEGFEFNFGIA